MFEDIVQSYINKPSDETFIPDKLTEQIFASEVAKDLILENALENADQIFSASDIAYMKEEEILTESAMVALNEARTKTKILWADKDLINKYKSIYAINMARQKGWAEYKKLLTVWKLEKTLKGKIVKKAGSTAQKGAIEMFKEHKKKMRNKKTKKK